MAKNNKKRIRLTKSQRELIFKKTKGHCHVCGCELEGKWTADHVVPHASGGECEIDNFLPCCYECNRLRWFYSPQTLKKILQLGVYCNSEIQKATKLGNQIQELFLNRIKQNHKRRKKNQK